MDAADGCKAADLIVLAAPVRASIQLLTVVAPYLRPGAFETDLGSTKMAIAREAAAILGPGRFIGGHPMAGSHLSGIGAARPDLFENARYLLTTDPAADPCGQELMNALALGVGAKPQWMTAEAHDRLVARISHLPHLAACALVECADGCDFAGISAFSLVSTGFRDTTRVAAGQPDMCTDICLTNQASLLESLDAFQEALRRLRERIASRDELPLHDWLDTTAKARRQLDRRGNDAGIDAENDAGDAAGHGAE